MTHAAARRRDDLRDAGPGRLHRRVPVRVRGHARGAREVAPGRVRGPRSRSAPSTVRAPWSTSRPTPEASRTRPRSSTTTSAAPDPRALQGRDRSTRSRHGRSPRRVGGFSPREGRRPAQGDRQEEPRSSWRACSRSRRRACGRAACRDRVARKLWSQFEATGDYSFNKSHAACYALIAYRTAWLKAQLPGRVHGGADLQRDEHQGQGAVLRRPVPRDGHRGAAARRQRERRRLYRRRRARSVSASNAVKGVGRRRHRGDLKARGGRPFHLAVRLLRSGSIRPSSTSARSRR